MQFPASALIRRELLTSLRRPRSFVVLALFIGVCIAGIGMAWPDQERLFVGLAELSRGLVSSVSLLLLATCALVVPALAAGAVIVERDQETFDLLRLTLIPPRAMLLAKLISVVGFFLLLLVAALPVFGTVFFLIGLEWMVLAQAIAVLTATAMTCASAGLMSSARSRHITRAVLGSYLGLFVLMAAGPMVGFFLSLILNLLTGGRFIQAVVGDTMAIGAPYSTLQALFQGRLSGGAFILAILVQVVFTMFCLSQALRGLSRPLATPMVEQFKPIDDPRVLKQRRRTFPYYLLDPLKRKKPIEDGRNPVLVRELRWGLLDRASTLIRIFYIAFVIYLFIGGVGFISAPRPGKMSEGFVHGWLLAQIAGTVLVAPAVLANTFTREYESGSMDMLRTTLLTPRDIVIGKLFAGMSAIAPLVLAAVGSSLTMLRWILPEADLLVAGYITLLLCAVVCLALGMIASLLTTHTTTALVLTYLFTFAVFLGTWMASVVIPVAKFSVFEWLMSPIAVFADLAGASSPFTVIWVGNQIVFWTLAAILVTIAVQGYAKFRMRET